jgi:hypothetical protein
MLEFGLVAQLDWSSKSEEPRFTGNFKKVSQPKIGSLKQDKAHNFSL